MRTNGDLGSDDLVPSVFALPNVPGRVYIETKNHDALLRMAKQAMWKNSAINTFFHTYSDLARTLDEWKSSFCEGVWVRISSGMYEGDVGILVCAPVDGSVRVQVVPRWSASGEEDVCLHPKRRLVEMRILEDKATFKATHAGFTFEERTFTRDGFLLMTVPASEVSLTAPHEDEISLFKAHGISGWRYRVSPFVSNSNLVTILSGRFERALGRVVNVFEEGKVEVVTVDASLDNVVPPKKTVLHVRDVLRFFVCGEKVEVKLGKYTGVCGIVVGRFEETLELAQEHSSDKARAGRWLPNATVTNHRYAYASRLGRYACPLSSSMPRCLKDIRQERPRA